VIHLRAVHACPTPRADARLRQHNCAQTTDRLRDELDKVRPLLRWPLRQKIREAA
jgi:hypothetical protein